MRNANELIHNSRITRELRNKWADKDGTLRCINCGCQAHIRWHHVVPLGKGGNDTTSNIVPVCDRCHAAIHTNAERHYSDDRVWGGRPRKIPPNWEEVLDEYIECRIGKKLLMSLLDIKAVDLTDRPWYREYLEKRGISKVRNNIDIILKKGRSLEIGDRVGYHIMKDGLTIEKYYI